MKAKTLWLVHEQSDETTPVHGDVVIGRDKGDLIFDHDPKLSSKHCMIRQSESGCTVIDLKSRTGIFVNGTHVPHGKAVVLKPGQRLTVGDQTFLVARDEPRAHNVTLLAAAAAAIAVMAILHFSL